MLEQVRRRVAPDPPPPRPAGIQGRSAVQAIGLATLLLAIGACSLSPRQDPSQFYTLTTSGGDGAGGAPGAAGAVLKASIGVGPVRLPGYLDRPQMVTRISEVQVSISEFERWAEPLKANFTTVLARNLEIELGTTRIETFPWSVAVDRSVNVTVYRFEVDSSGTANLRCRWSITDQLGATVLSGESSYQEQAADATTDAAVAALSRTVQRLSADIATATQRLPADG